MTKNLFLKYFKKFQYDRESALIDYRENLIKSLLVQSNVSDPTNSLKLIERQFIPIHLQDVSTSGKSSSVTIGTALKENQHLAIVGAAGSGKSTLLKYLALFSALGYIQDISNLPILVQLAKLDQLANIEKEIASRIEKLAESRITDEDVTKLLEQGRILLLLDGLNEVENVPLICQEILRLSQSFPRIHIIVTSRHPSEVETLNFEIFQVSPLSESDIRRLIDYWASDESVLAETFWNILQGDTALNELARNPLLLRIMLDVYLKQGQLPRTRATLSDAYLNSLLPSLFKQLPNLAEQLAEQIALYLYTNREYVIGYDEIISQNKQFTKKFQTEAEIDNELSTLDKNGALERLEQNKFRFTHQLIQEHFCVRALKNLSQDELLSLIIEYASDEWWEPVLTSLVRRRSDSTQIVNSLAKSTDSSQRLLAAKLLTEGVEADPLLRYKITKNLCEFLGQHNANETVRISNLLVKLNEPETNNICRSFLFEKTIDPLTASSLAYVLAARGQKEDKLYDILFKTFRDKNDITRYQTCRALGAIDTQQSAELLVHYLQEETNNEVLQQILSSLHRKSSLPSQVQASTLVQLLAELAELRRTEENPDIQSWAEQLNRKITIENLAYEAQ